MNMPEPENIRGVRRDSVIDEGGGIIPRTIGEDEDGGGAERGGGVLYRLAGHIEAPVKLRGFLFFVPSTEKPAAVTPS